MENQIPETVKTQRSHVLLELNEKNQKAYVQGIAGKKVEVLFEESVMSEGRKCFVGHTKEYVKVCIPSGEEDWSNKISDCILRESDVQYT